MGNLTFVGEGFQFGATSVGEEPGGFEELVEDVVAEGYHPADLSCDVLENFWYISAALMQLMLEPYQAYLFRDPQRRRYVLGPVLEEQSSVTARLDAGFVG